MKPEAQLIPVTVIAGYFGAGKTTWINHRIRAGLDPGTMILVNDFGDINIDAGLISYRDDGIIQLQNGCICCTLGGTLADALSGLLRRTPRPTAVLIEASGIARPGPVADVARVSRQLRLQQVLCLIDCQAVDARLDDPDALELVAAQIGESDTVLLNKTQSLSPEDLARIRRRVRECAPHAVIAQAPEDMAPEAGEPARRASASPSRSVGGAGGGSGGGRQMVSFILRCASLGNRVQLEDLLLDHAEVLVRAKGLVVFMDDAVPGRVLQYVDGAVICTPTTTKGRGVQLVCIGYAGPLLDQLRARLQALAN